MRPRRLAVAILVGSACTTGASAPRADAFNPLKPVCSVGGFISGLVGKACTVVSHAGNLVKAGKKLATGHIGSAFKTALGEGGSSVASKATFALGLAAMVSWVLGGARYALNETAAVISRTTTPQLQSTWFSATYWRVAGIAAVLTLPFLFAAAIQALIQSDLALLVRAALGYLPLAMLCVSIAAPLTMLLLSASDELSAFVSSAAGNASAHFLNRASGAIGALTVLSRSPFLVFFTGLLTVAGAVVLWIELLLRAAAVYVIVLMLPLAFAALVWPARRIWAVRAVELLVALILSKFVIVAVLALGGAALSQEALTSISGLLAGLVLLAMGALAPWALLRLLPLAEMASGAVGSLRGDAAAPRRWIGVAYGGADAANDWAVTTAEMRRQAQDAAPSEVDRAAGPQIEPPARVGPLAAAGSAVGTDRAGVPPPPPGGSDGGQPEPTGDGAQPSGNEHPGQPAGRSPGLGPIWQMDDFTWPVLTLGLEDGWPPRPLDDQGGAPSAPLADDHDTPMAGPPPDGCPDPGRDHVAASHEDHDPTPPPQGPEEGRL